MLSEVRDTYIYTPVISVYITRKSVTKLTLGQSQEKIGNKRQDYANRVGILEQRKSDRQQCE